MEQAKNPGQQGGHIAVNAEYLQRIKILSEGNEIENHDFRAWLKNYAPDDIDDLLKALSQKYFALIDCKECANCCRVLELQFTEPELHTIANSMEQSIDEFKKRFVVEGIMKPCPALKGNLCSIYEGRPEVCRSYPHLEKPDLIFSLYGVLDNIGICPIAFNAFEELKAQVQWSKETFHLPGQFRAGFHVDDCVYQKLAIDEARTSPRRDANSRGRKL